MTKRNLSIVSLLIQVLAIYPLFTGETFSGGRGGFFEYFSEMSIDGNEILFLAYVFLVTIIFNCLCSVIFIFKNMPSIESKKFISVSIFTLALYVVICLGVKYSVWVTWSNMPHSFRSMYYVEVIILLFNILVECAKRYIKMPYSKESVGDKKETAADEIEKYKKLLDSGAINQEEFDTKKKELLGL